MQATVKFPVRCKLAEGPVWYQDRLWWVDIQARQILNQKNATERPGRYNLPELVGFAVPARDGTWVVGLGTGIYRWDPSRDFLERMHDPEAADTTTRFNDGKCDPAGKLWAGTMCLSGPAERASLYRSNGRVCDRVLTGVTISNGLAWNALCGKMYFIDTPTRLIREYDWNPEDSSLTGGRVLYEFSGNSGSPDGMTIDRDGRLWVALWGGHGVSCINPQSGREEARIQLPVPNVTSCTFGGKDLDTLYITTASVGIPETDRDTYPDAGSIFSVKPGCRGLPPTLF